MNENDLNFYSKVIEAMIFASSDPIKEDTLIAKLPENIEFEKVINEIKQLYSNRGVECIKIGNAWAFRTILEVGEYLNIEKIETKPLSRAALETLSIIAYHQPITRGEIEKIRGVSISRGSLDVLLELNWIRPKGRRSSPGRPITWGTTEIFLDKFCLEDIKSLPGLSDLKAAGLVGLNSVISDDIGSLENNKNIKNKTLLRDIESN